MERLNTAPKGNHTVKWLFAEPEVERVLKKICIEEGSDIKVLFHIGNHSTAVRSSKGKYIIGAEVASLITV